MFKLIKMQNSRTNVPEIVKVNTDSTTYYRKGCVYFIVDGKAVPTYSTLSDIRFIPIEEIPKGTGKDKVAGYFVTEDMIFETQANGSSQASLKAGAFVDFECDQYGNNIATTSIAGEEVLVLSVDSITQDKKILVALKW